MMALAGMLATPEPARAQSAPTLSGTWSATAMREQWNIGDWGPKCGPRPSSQASPGGTVHITQQGNELLITGAGRSYSTTQCWEQYQGLQRVSHSAASRGWSNRCVTAPTDPRRATVITTISATDDRINFDETGQYQFVLEGQNCTASVRRTRSFKLLQRLGDAPVASTASAVPSASASVPQVVPPASATAEPHSESRCVPGAPARLEVRPSRKLMRPGERFTFHARVLDSKGCSLDTRAAWHAVSDQANVRVSNDGEVVVDPGSAEGVAQLTASVRGHAVQVSVEVTSAQRYEALLSTRGLNAAGETDDAAVAILATASLGGDTATVEDSARQRKIVFAAAVGGAAVILAAAGLVMMRTNGNRGRKRKAAPIADDATPAKPQAAGQAAAPVTTPPMLCPVCHRRYPPDSLFCPRDGTRLVMAQPNMKAEPSGGMCPVCGRGFGPRLSRCPEHGESLIPAAVYKATRVQKPTKVEPKGKICPTCGARYGGDATFCGQDGTSLVLIN